MLLGSRGFFGRWPMTVYCTVREPRAATFLHSMDNSILTGIGVRAFLPCSLCANGSLVQSALVGLVIGLSRRACAANTRT